MLPKKLQDWTEQAIVKVLHSGIYEGATFDFKEHVTNPKNPYDGERLAQVACSFANTEGGFIIFGVKDKGPSEQRLCGLKDNEAAAHFQDNLSKILPNAPHWEPGIPITLNNGNSVWVAHIPKSLQLHSVIKKGTEDHGVYYKRTQGGQSVPMSSQELATAHYQTQYRGSVLKKADIRNAKKLLADFDNMTAVLVKMDFSKDLVNTGITLPIVKAADGLIPKPKFETASISFTSEKLREAYQDLLKANNAFYELWSKCTHLANRRFRSHIDFERVFSEESWKEWGQK